MYEPTAYGGRHEGPLPVLYVLDGGLDEDFLDRYVVSPGDYAPEDYRWAR